MTDTIENLIIEQLRHIRKAVDRNAEEMSDVKMRLSSLERSTAGLHVDLAQMNYRLDMFDRRLDRIEHRLELSENPGEN